MAGSKISLESNVQLLPGQAVSVEVHETDNGLQLKITPQQVPAASQGSSSQLATALSSIIKSFPALQSLENPEQLLPANIPPTEAAIRNLFALFATRQSMTEDLQFLTSLLTQAADSGIIPQEYATDFSAIISRFIAGNADNLQSILQQLVGNTGINIEAQIASALASGNIDELLNKLRGSLRWQVARLRGNEALMKFLQGSGQLRAFQNAVESIIERLSGSQLQNLRSLEQSYLFLEVPFTEDSGINRAQVHFFGKGGGKGQRFDAKNSTVMLDLSTSKLGDLWIALQMVSGHCTCTLRAANPESVELINAASSELAEALDEAGYPNARVVVGQWRGNRLQEVANMMRRFTGFNTAI